MIRIRSVVPLEGFRVRLGFTDGTEGELDLEPYMVGPMFEALRRDRRLFEAVSVHPRFKTIVWPNDADMDPDVLYELAHRASVGD